MDSKTAMIKSDFIKPNLRCDDQKYEFIIILDRSSSMDGDKIVLAKQALHFALQSLPVSCFFNVVAFNGTHSMIFEASQPYTQENICIAKKFLDGINAMGYTNLFPVLQDILSSKPVPAHLRQLYIITDGQVSQPKETIELVAHNRQRWRCFTIGIGKDVDFNNIREIASSSGGTYAFAHESKSIRSELITQFKTTLLPGALKPVIVPRVQNLLGPGTPTSLTT
ncbi:von Willebrand factor A domain-containing protein 5A [Folsomia candida]|uniref:von Willebrand factor A domain-containing protein 5A n=1 Tax=Folsomia candida TaxID=158441 RepID=UPI000B8F8AD5|nr:von Willebrand factor A domain-containing protein 5A [Folsomia candida]